MSSYLFVYGTLRKRCSFLMHNLIDRYSNFFANGFVYGKLYEIDNYPGIVLSNDIQNIVYGEVYKIKSYKVDYMLNLLDEYEECSKNFPKPHEYKRVITDVILMNGKRLKSWIYEYNYSIRNLECIKSGDYIDYINKKHNYK